MSIAAVCTPTAASARTSGPEPAAARAGAAPMQSGISIGASISPEPCRVETTNDQSTSPARPAGARTDSGVRRDRWTSAVTTSRPIATLRSTTRSIAMPKATAAAKRASDAACPTAIGTSERSARA